MTIAEYFDHTNLDPAASTEAIEQLCREALEYNFFSVCIHPIHVTLAKRLLQDSPVKVTTVVGFPLGQNLTSVKVFETIQAVADGADEIDMVMNYGALIEGNYDLVKQDIRAVRQACSEKVLKVILETSQLTDQQIITACELAELAEADFVKTSTGFRGDGAKVDQVKLMKTYFHGLVKASGGIRTYDDWKAMVDAGADRIGASASVAIVNQAP
ncbi:MAG: deoxyribose-phosphate aldolase [Tissierellia bacterium]|jgi:deoxyribose-phosphate aldolase|nr:deoxyribose-phosphate aldolase [Tissierellia bacterium]